MNSYFQLEPSTTPIEEGSDGTGSNDAVLEVMEDDEGRVVKADAIPKEIGAAKVANHSADRNADGRSNTSATANLLDEEEGATAIRKPKQSVHSNPDEPRRPTRIIESVQNEDISIEVRPRGASTSPTATHGATIVRGMPPQPRSSNPSFTRDQTTAQQQNIRAAPAVLIPHAEYLYTVRGGFSTYQVFNNRHSGPSRSRRCGGPFCSFFLGAINWQPLRPYQPSARALRKIEKSMGDQGEVNYLLSSYMAWRKAALIYVLPFLAVAFGISIHQFSKKVMSGLIFEHEGMDIQIPYSGFGLFAVLSRDIFPSLIWFSGCILALYTWTELRISLKIMYFSAVLAMVSFLWPLAIQGRHFVVFEDRVSSNQTEVFDYITDITYGSMITSNSLRNVIGDILPILLGFPRGLTSAAFAVFGLVKGSITPGILVVFLSPFSTLMLYLICTFIANVAGDWVFFIAAVLFFVSDIRLFTATKHFLTGDVDTMLRTHVMQHRSVLHMAGLVFALIWFGFLAKPCAELGLEYFKVNREASDMTDIDYLRFTFEEILKESHRYNYQGAGYCANLILVQNVDFYDMALAIGRALADFSTKYFITKIIAIDLILRATFFVEGKGTDLGLENVHFMHSYNQVIKYSG